MVKTETVLHLVWGILLFDGQVHVLTFFLLSLLFHGFTDVLKFDRLHFNWPFAIGDNDVHDQVYAISVELFVVHISPLISACRNPTDFICAQVLGVLHLGETACNRVC